jgi:hypothetical protein
MNDDVSVYILECTEKYIVLKAPPECGLNAVTFYANGMYSLSRHDDKPNRSWRMIENNILSWKCNNYSQQWEEGGFFDHSEDMSDTYNKAYTKILKDYLKSQEEVEKILLID